jgi:hypothetical protein
MTAAYIKEQPKDIWVRTTRTAKLLLLIAALVALESWNRMQMLKDSHDPLPSALNEFTAKYREPLVEWYQKFLDLIEPRSESPTYRE